MEKTEFEKEIKNYAIELGINLNENQISQFYKYMVLLIEWNKVVNLTSITDPKDIIIKHFIDSLTVIKNISEDNTIIDVGTGAGFPGIPIKIVCPKSKIVLLDSLNKRVSFLKEVIKELELKDIEVIHGRAEDFGRNKNYRENFDIAIARAVAPLNILLEYLVPFLKINGNCLCMKGSNCAEEIQNSTNAIKVLGGETEEIVEFD